LNKKKKITFNDFINKIITLSDEFDSKEEELDITEKKLTSEVNKMLGKVFPEIRKEQEKMLERMKNAWDIKEEIKEKSDKAISDLVKFIRSDVEVPLFRQGDGSKIVINKDGLSKVPYRHQNGTHISTITDILKLIEQNTSEFNSIRDEGIKDRIKCFLGACHHLGGLKDAVNRFDSNVDVKTLLPPKTKVKWINADEDKVSTITIENIEIAAEEISINNDEITLEPLSLDSWFTIEQIKEYLNKTFEAIEKNIDEDRKAVNDAINKLKEPLAPVLMLEAI
jgi:molybdopterin converting factor small subunit